MADTRVTTADTEVQKGKLLYTVGTIKPDPELAYSPAIPLPGKSQKT